jgi:hypothetical protein
MMGLLTSNNRGEGPVVVGYWIVVGLLGVFYLHGGGRKLAQGREQLAPMMGWVDTVAMPVVRLIGVIEILGVLGLVLPPLTGLPRRWRSRPP